MVCATEHALLYQAIAVKDRVDPDFVGEDRLTFTARSEAAHPSGKSFFFSKSLGKR